MRAFSGLLLVVGAGVALGCGDETKEECDPEFNDIQVALNEFCTQEAICERMLPDSPFHHEVCGREDMCEPYSVPGTPCDGKDENCIFNEVMGLCYPDTDTCVPRCNNHADCPIFWFCDRRPEAMEKTGDRGICVRPSVICCDEEECPPEHPCVCSSDLREQLRIHIEMQEESGYGPHWDGGAQACCISMSYPW